MTSFIKSEDKMVDVLGPFEDKENAANRALGARADIGVKQMSNLHESHISVVSSACSSPNKSGISSLRVLQLFSTK